MTAIAVGPTRPGGISQIPAKTHTKRLTFAAKIKRTVGLEPALYERLLAVADRERRSLSGQIAEFIEDRLDIWAAAERACREATPKVVSASDGECLTA